MKKVVENFYTVLNEIEFRIKLNFSESCEKFWDLWISKLSSTISATINLLQLSLDSLIGGREISVGGLSGKVRELYQ